MQQHRNLIIGLDLSHNSTGICIFRRENQQPVGISFHRVIFDAEKSKTGKIYAPKEQRNIEHKIYRMPVNLSTKDLMFDNEDYTTESQLDITRKSKMSQKVILSVVGDVIKEFKPDAIYFAIENYIMPTGFAGKAALQNVSGLIMLQSFIRDFIINLSVEYQKVGKVIKLITPTPPTVKKFFTQNGSADKELMKRVFIDKYEGDKYIGVEGKIDDIIDSFALMCYCYKLVLQSEYKKTINKHKDIEIEDDELFANHF